MPRLLVALVALVLLAAPATPAAAAAKHVQTNAPPGNSAIDEYLETVPNASGSASPRPPTAGGGSAGALTAAQRAKLQRLGSDGRALVEAVNATSPARASSKPGGRSPATPPLQGRSPLGQILDIAVGRDGGGGMGLLLPGILFASLLGIITLAVVRRRSAS